MKFETSTSAAIAHVRRFEPYRPGGSLYSRNRPPRPGANLDGTSA